MQDIDFYTKIETRVAFAGRRNRLLVNWFSAAHNGSNQELLSYWAERIQAVNDAEITLLGASY